MSQSFDLVKKPMIAAGLLAATIFVTGCSQQQVNSVPGSGLFGSVQTANAASGAIPTQTNFRQSSAVASQTAELTAQASFPQ